MNPTPEQARILSSLSGPLRIAAGAGTGKTDTLRRAVVELIGRGVRPGEILCLTFTVEATKEMRRRVLDEFEARTDVDADEISVQTYHAFAASVVHEHALLVGLEPDTALLDQARKWQLLLEALDQCSFDDLEIGWLPTFVGRLLALHDEVQRHDLSLEQVRAWCAPRIGEDVIRNRLEALRALEAYRELKRKRNAIDFGDQITIANELLRSHPEILERLRQRYRYVFLDEYQDTDVAQRELVKLLGSGADLVCVVGDVDQGIFGWRGATIHNMFAFPTDFPGARTETLSTNFRSGQRVLNLANAIIAGYEPPENYERAPLQAVAGAPASEIEAFVAPHAVDEAARIAELIAESGAPWSQYAVLVRRRADLNQLFSALVERDVPVEVDTLGGFWMRPEILDVVAWLELLADPGNNIALARILLGPAYRLSRRDLFFLADKAKGANRENRYRRHGDRFVLPYSLIDAIVGHEEVAEVSADARQRLGELRTVWSELSRIAARSSLADLVGEVARVTGLASELAASPNPEAAMAQHHLAKLRDLAQSYQPVAGSADLAGFVRYLDSIEESDQDEDELRAVEENAVKLMTIFRAKGLEWETVFLPSLATGIMPSARKSENPAQCWFRLPFELRGDRDFLPVETDEGLAELKADEERRLMYVGVTRAKRRLVLSRAWYYADNKKPKASSVFWDNALETGLVRLIVDVPCPAENPHPVVDEAAAASRPVPTPEPGAITQIEAELERLRTLEEVRPCAAVWHCPPTISVTALLTFVRDEEEFFWRYVRRTPTPPSPAATLGIELHRRIEEHARGAVPLGGAEVEEPYDLDPSERRGDGKAVSAEEMWENFQRSRFAAIKPLMVEQPFTLYVDEGLSVEGRIDAIFEREDGVWELVDYKTGTKAPDPLQLAIYARAVGKIWSKPTAPTWLNLRTGAEQTATSVEGLAEILNQAAQALRQLR